MTDGEIVYIHGQVNNQSRRGNQGLVRSKHLMIYTGNSWTAPPSTFGENSPVGGAESKMPRAQREFRKPAHPSSKDFTVVQSESDILKDITCHQGLSHAMVRRSRLTHSFLCQRRYILFHAFDKASGSYSRCFDAPQVVRRRSDLFMYICIPKSYRF